MRILDKNKDFYDYIQDTYKDDSIVFDRRNSFIFKNEDFNNLFYKMKARNKKSRYYMCQNEYCADDNYILMQVGNKFWLLNVHGLEYVIDYSRCLSGSDEYYKCLKSKVSCIAKWSDYDTERKLISISILHFWYSFFCKLIKEGLTDKNIDAIKNIIKTNDLREIDDITTGGGLYNEKNNKGKIPILKEIGIASAIDPLDIYLAFDEYFSNEKTANERIESIGITDIEKIENHGFDKKTSFRNM